MGITYIDRSAPRVDAVDIPDESGLKSNLNRIPFEPRSIVHCYFSFHNDAAQVEENDQASSTKRNIRLWSTRTTYRRRDQQRPDVEHFVRALTSGGISDQYVVAPNAPDPTGRDRTPYDVGVAEQCYVVIELDDECDWMFSQKYDGFQAKAGHFEGETTDLRHVHPGTGESSSSHIKDDECMIIHFRVRERKDREPRFFYCNVRLVDRKTGHAVEIGIDPDVPNSGNNPTIP